MSPRSIHRVDEWWADLFGLPVTLLWTSPTTVGMHAGLADFPGIFVAERSGAVHVSLPDWVTPDEVDEIAGAGPALMDASFWSSWGPTSDMIVLGPATHAFTDAEVASDVRANDVRLLAPDDLDTLRTAVDEDEWEEGGFAHVQGMVHAVLDGDTVVAAASLSAFLGPAGDVGVLVHPARRGEGLGAVVGGAATRDALRRQGIARWRARDENRPSRALSRRLGFEDYCRQLAVRPAT